MEAGVVPHLDAMFRPAPFLARRNQADAEDSRAVVRAVDGFPASGRVNARHIDRSGPKGRKTGWARSVVA